jgi:AcrR family transcriptional regulator
MNGMSTLLAGEAARRPGGRTAEVTQRIHDAIIALLVEDGVHACTFSAVAERAGIERSTLYRRFPDRWDAIVDALMKRAADEITPDLGGNFAHDLTSVLRKLVTILETPLGPAVLAVAAELRAHNASQYPEDHFDQRMEQLAPMFDAAIARGELPEDVDRKALFAFAAGPIYFGMFLVGRTIDDAYIDDIVQKVCRLYCA